MWCEKFTRKHNFISKQNHLKTKLERVRVSRRKKNKGKKKRKKKKKEKKKKIGNNTIMEILARTSQVRF